MKNVLVKKLRVVTFICLLAAGVLLRNNHTALAAEKVEIQSVDYVDHNVFVVNGDNTKFYFATELDASKNKWEIMKIDSGTTTEIDFSWMPPSSNNVLVIKGDVDTEKTRIIINKKTTKLQIALDFQSLALLEPENKVESVLSIVTDAGTASDPIDSTDLEWKKGTDGVWKTMDSLSVGLIQKYMIKGADLYFRISAVNDDKVGDPHDGTKGRRISQEYRLKIARISDAKVVGVDGKKFKINIKYGKEYRIKKVGDTDFGNWIQVNERTAKDLSLKDLFGDETKYDGTVNEKAFPGALIEVRDYATSTKAASKISENSIPEQRTLKGEIKDYPVPATADETDMNIYVDYFSTKNMLVTIPSASAELPYEYCVAQSSGLDFNKVSWTPITTNEEVKILSSKAIDGGTIYFRQAEIKYKPKTDASPEVKYELASTYESVKINYPATPIVEDKNFSYMKKYSDPITFTITLNQEGKYPFEKEIDSIKFGTKIIDYDKSYNTDPREGTLDKDYVYKLTVTLKASSLDSLPDTYSKPIYITFKNGNTDKTSIRITVLSAKSAPIMTASIAAGGAKDTTTATVVGDPATGNKLIYTKSDIEVKDLTLEDKITGTDFASGVTNIPVTTSDYLTLYEVTSEGNVVRYKCIKVTADKIKTE